MTDDVRRLPAENKVRMLRTQRNWSLHKLANMAGVSPHTIWRLERGMIPVLSNAMKVAQAFDLTVYELWDIPGPHVIPWVTPTTANGNKLRTLRLERSWTLADLTERAKVPRSTIAQMERGRSSTLANAVRIAAAFGLSVYDIWSIPIRRQET